jgi:hypothetical protein
VSPRCACSPPRNDRECHGKSAVQLQHLSSSSGCGGSLCCCGFVRGVSCGGGGCSLRSRNGSSPGTPLLRYETCAVLYTRVLLSRGPQRPSEPHCQHHQCDAPSGQQQVAPYRHGSGERIRCRPAIGDCGSTRIEYSGASCDDEQQDTHALHPNGVRPHERANDEDPRCDAKARQGYERCFQSGCRGLSGFGCKGAEPC